jgi:molybdenum cofactor cytidylyltransferase
MNDEYIKSNQIDEPPVPLADCIICAAGASRRMGEWKLSLPWFHPGWNGSPSVPFAVRAQPSDWPIFPSHENWLVDAAVQSALSAGCRVILVTGFRGTELEERFAPLQNVCVVRNNRWETGMVSSVQAGLPYIQTSWFFVAHGDMPLISSRWYRSLFANRPSADGEDQASVLRPFYVSNKGQSKQPGHPVLFSASAIPLLQQAPEGDSLKPLLSQCNVRTIDTTDQEVIHDVDSLETYITALTLSRSSENKQHPGTRVHPGPVETRPALSSVRLISGAPGSGKTTLLRRESFRSFINLITSNQAPSSLSVLISQVQVGQRRDGKAPGFDIEAFYQLPGGSISFFRHALCRSIDEFQVSEPITLGPYQFDSAAFENLERWLAPVLEYAESYRSIHVYIDELGKLELDQQRGLWPLVNRLVDHVVQAAAAGCSYELVCTVRKDRISQLTSHFTNKGFQSALFDLSEYSGSPL